MRHCVGYTEHYLTACSLSRIINRFSNVDIYIYAVNKFNVWMSKVIDTTILYDLNQTTVNKMLLKVISPQSLFKSEPWTDNLSLTRDNIGRKNRKITVNYFMMMKHINSIRALYN